MTTPRRGVAVCIASILAAIGAACSGTDSGDGLTGNDAAGSGKSGAAGGGGAGAAGAAGGAPGGGGAGAAGAAGGAPAAITPLAGEYDLIPTSTRALGYLAMQAKTPPVHLSLQKSPGGLTATLSTPYETVVAGVVTVDASASLSPVPMQAPFVPAGPLVIVGQVKLGNDSLSSIAFDLDADGRPSRAVASGYHELEPPSWCIQTAKGDPFGGTYDVVSDTKAPALLTAVERLPWEPVFLASEPVVAVTASATGATLISMMVNGLRVTPKFGGELFQLLGKTIDFTFDPLSDRAGTASVPADASVTYGDPGAPVEARAYGSPGNCDGDVLVGAFGAAVPSKKRVMGRFARNGAKVANVSVCGSTSHSSTVVAEAWATDGSHTAATLLTGAQPTSTLVLTLPSEDVVITVDASGCGGLRMSSIALE